MRRNRYLLLISFVLLLASGTGAWADEAVSPGAAKKAPETLLELILAGGPVNIGFLSVLGIFSLLGLAIILERLVNLTTVKLIPPGFVRDLQELIGRKENKSKPFEELCERHPSVIASILKGGLRRAGRPVLEVEKGLEDTAARELSILRSRIRPLTVLASVGPLVGLLGTAVGMILVFRTASQEGLGKAELLAEGIYLKLETTVAGLIVAVPSLLFAAVFNSRTEKFLRLMDEYLMDAPLCIARMEQPEAEHLAARERVKAGK